MDEELRQYLERIMQGVSAQGQEMRQEIGTLRQEMGTLRQELMAHTEEVETRLLGEFFKWARTSDARYRQHHGVVAGLDERVQAVEDRISELERRR